jgi:hypothetical protein
MLLITIWFVKNVPLVDKNIRLEEMVVKDYLATATFREGRKPKIKMALPCIPSILKKIGRLIFFLRFTLHLPFPSPNLITLLPFAAIFLDKSER